MHGGKWISDLTAGTPLADAARRVLALRLEVVRDNLGLALRESDKDPEHVHQLRVGTRRAGGALNIFRLCLPENVGRKARKNLRRIRQAAGEARDWDVFLTGLLKDTRRRGARHQAGHDFLVGHAMAHRIAAQSHLEEAGQDYPYAFERLVTQTLHAVHRPDDSGMRTLADLAHPVLLSLAKELSQAASQDLNDYEHLHQVRIIGKRLRYAMEVFVECFAAPFRDTIYPAVEEMQEILGRANDSYVACRRLGNLCDRLHAISSASSKRFKPGIQALLAYHEQRLPEERQRFVEWWTNWHESGYESVFSALLMSPEPPSPRRLLPEPVAPRPGPADTTPTPGRTSTPARPSRTNRQRHRRTG